ncbi:MAG: hypothetical protein JRJ68_04915 [Deltaproteobacteria bacterium]|nr:hypothetical protein [Deltaproteobacteria bacterium]
MKADSTDGKTHFPALNPPFVKNHSPQSQPYSSYNPGNREKITEWKFHKSDDGSHPDGHEQQIVWLMNRARANPAAEGIWLAASTDPDVVGGRSYFGVDKNKLRFEFAALGAKPPAVFDNRLYAAALVHSLDLIARDAQDHNQQFDRVNAAGFHHQGGRGSVFAYADSGLNAHAAWNIDWGGGPPDGMQTGRGHRMATMSGDGSYTNVGIAAVYEANPSTSVGEYVTTGNYCLADTSYDNHFNRFLVGTVWTDNNKNGQYDPGEGLGDVTVGADRGTYFAITGDSGGYAFPLSDGIYSITFRGSSLPCTFTKSITVSGKSVLADIETKADFTGGNCDNDKKALPLPAIILLLQDQH